MYEIWANQENPSLHLVLKEGTAFPDPTPMVNWTLMGVARVTAEIAAVVARDGQAEVTSVVPFDPQGVFGPGGEAVGAQSQTPR